MILMILDLELKTKKKINKNTYTTTIKSFKYPTAYIYLGANYSLTSRPYIMARCQGYLHFS